MSKILNNPEIFQINRLEAHSDHLYFETLDSAKNLEEIELKQSLNGTWKFQFSKNLDEREEEFYKENFDSNHFKDIIVPGHIQLQGFDRMQYINTLYLWDGREHLRPPHISEVDNPIGSYIKEFELNDNLINKDIFISFQGVETAFSFWINGNFVGYNEIGERNNLVYQLLNYFLSPIFFIFFSYSLTKNNYFFINPSFS
ncbi:hypothetical protein H5986_02905 [Fusobacterium mortiferum]|nr:hypothetical protein [Fusobacterium mortiferum]